MAAKKSKPAAPAKGKAPAAGKKKSASSQTARKKAAARREWEIQRNRFILGIVLFLLAVFLLLVFFIPGERLWESMHFGYWGLCGFLGFAPPLLMLYGAYQNCRDHPAPYYRLKILLMSGSVTLFSTIIHVLETTEKEALLSYPDALHNSFYQGGSGGGAGVWGGLLGVPVLHLLGLVGGAIVSIILFLIVLALTLNMFILNFSETIKRPVRMVEEHLSDSREIRTQVRTRREEQRSEERSARRQEHIRQEVDRKLARQQEDDTFRRLKRSPFYSPAGAPPPEAKPTSPAAPPASPAAPVCEPPSAPARRKKKEEMPVFSDDILITGVNIDPKDLTGEPEVSTPPPSPAAAVQPHPSAPAPAAPPAPGAKKGEKIPPVLDFEPDLSEKPEYVKPPTALLAPQPAEQESNISLELNKNGTMLVDTLKSFGVQTSIVNISRGPSVTRYELQPAVGVKISKITNLSNDIAMNLAAVGVRIEAPIPGKSAVGIEVPNRHVSVVKMRGLIESREFQDAPGHLTVALGKDITGKMVFADLSKMPHLLIAGSTGSGKSVCINSMLISLLYKSSPEDVKLILVDPKVVELGVYNGIPHLLVPVVTDPRKAAGALNWAVNEMLNRYKLFAECNVRDMKGYNKYVERMNLEVQETAASEPVHAEEAERTFEEDEMLAQAQAERELSGDNAPQEPKKLRKMPQIVIIIDELADLMMAAPKDVEESICRLAQMARAAGMHLVIATQRPSVDVITGLIKANVPSRIAFAVKTLIDSRTILDSGGAEKLLGRGDMLYSPIGTGKPQRIQGCFVDDDEVERVIEFIKKNKTAEYDSSVIDEIENSALSSGGDKGAPEDDEDLDPLLEEAIKFVVEAGMASTSMLQRRLRVGYARAGRIIDDMEQLGVIGPHEGAKPRQVLMTYQQWLERSVSRSGNE